MTHETNSLGVHHFAAFHQEVHGYNPFPWQSEVVEEIASRGSWPSLVDVPTGLGKTTMLDVAVFLTALDAEAPYDRRVGRRRIFFVVDRRIVVDQAAEHASRISRALRDAVPKSVASIVAERLRNLAGDAAGEDILPVVKMRGGVTWESAWLKRPDLPAIVTGTVDQVGTRLLFRAYGGTQRRRSIDAALVGSDSLILVDEAHLSTALMTTLNSARAIDLSTQAVQSPSPAIVQLSATGHSPSGGWVSGFSEDTHLAHPVAAERLLARKSLTLHETPRKAAARVLATFAADLARAPGARVLVVCNTIDRARAVHFELQRHLPEDIRLSLLIGRSRPLDREQMASEVLHQFGADRTVTDTKAVLVATQTVEVGIDLDATALVTESSSWDALVQRVGRVNRRGSLADTPVIVVNDDDPQPSVYGNARHRTIDYLRTLVNGHQQFDASPLALRKLDPPAEAFMAPPIIPVLLPAHLNAWARTSPAPSNDPPLAPYLHGIDSGVPPITLAWRDGLLDHDENPVSPQDAGLLIDAVPLRAEECVEVSIGAVRRWLTDSKPAPLTEWDDEDDWDIPFAEEPRQRILRRTLRNDGTTEWRWSSAREIRPGDTLVVPAEHGGLDRYGWAPTSREPVIDVSELAALERNRPIVRLDEGLPKRLGLAAPDPEIWDLVWRWRTSDDPHSASDLEKQIKSRVTNWLASPEWIRPQPWSSPPSNQQLLSVSLADAEQKGASASGVTRLAALAESLIKADLQYGVIPQRASRPSPEQQLVVPLAVLRPERAASPWQDAHEEREDGTVNLQGRVTLAAHQAAVAERARSIAENLRVPPHLIDTIADAARWHDLGKVDPRFQAMLFGGDRLSATAAAEPLAKSGMPPGDAQQHRDARRNSGMPRGARHEAWSEALVATHLAQRSAPYPGDSELLLHLIASHHGYARPLMPIITDDENHALVAEVGGDLVRSALPKEVDVTAADRFQALNQRYGRWGLALLETIVRCADITVSAEGS